ncbi:uroporphyrinogen-III synthase [Arthrobacter sp. H35-D1]|uniref:uroporphyrinogen-III synthase n=1 Tax=Arthrobacter sp. H35-D1 TaxID=3046202 RepID=UPI0024BB5B0D|nr:uroporphyrinogen-III synthase [Arthrobacter sp. H35-D1]MDJ0314298.1 uroporphyrinogen-III synthase [Arthrobacter sp. H35-D1]
MTHPGAGPLTGLRVAVTRSADRAGALADALAAAGAEPVLVPLIDFEVGDDVALGAALLRLAAGEYRWLVISSITTVRALKQWCEGADTTLAELIPAATGVATIGPTSVAVLAAEGVQASLAPVDVQSAVGLVALWPSFAADDGGNARVLLPQSNLATPTLVDGIAAAGWTTEVVTAYRTVDYPARAELRLTSTLAARSPERGWIFEGRPATEEILLPARGPDRQGRAFGYSAEPPVLTPAQAAGEINAGAMNAVVLASGSAARRVAETMAPFPESCLLIAIGQPTRVEAERLGLRIAATAEHPTPAGIVAALAAARPHFSPAARQETP